MSLMTITAGSLTQSLNQSVPDLYVVIAKHSVLGMDHESICDVLSCTLAEIEEVESDELYKQVRTLIGAAQAQSRVDQTAGWDFIEDTALKNLAARLPFEKDGEFLLRVAAVANKAQRRTAPQDNVLDPGRVKGRVAVSLTSRLVQRLQEGGITETRTVERTLSIADGSMQNPSFDDVDDFLQVRRGHELPRVHISHADESFVEDLDQAMKEKGF